jgi:hypothetical protein
MMRRALEIIGAVAAALVVFGVTSVGALIGLNAECNGSSAECPHSDAYRVALLAVPPTTAVLLLGGAIWSIRGRRLRPLVLAEAAALGVAVLIDAALQGPDAGTLVFGGLAIGPAAAATRSRWKPWFRPLSKP